MSFCSCPDRMLKILIKKKKKSMQTKPCIFYEEDGIEVFLSLGGRALIALSVAIWGWNQNDLPSSYILQCDLAVGFVYSARDSPMGETSNIILEIHPTCWM